MKQFNLEEALAGAKVVTLNGIELSVIAYFPELHQPVVSVISGMLCNWNEDGTYMREGREHSWDLFMASTKRTVWVNLYSDGRACHHKTEAGANAGASGTLAGGRLGNRAWPLEIEE